ncbi:MAG: DNA/RNA nuclease SfsA [Clostridia bacterium]|nr:DNA/RNA nuclease SfsA [Clostridia bacterium]
MQYGKIVKARFLERPNRFVAVVDLDGNKIPVHVKNTGRCKELLVEGAPVYLEDHSGRGRKLDYDLIAVEKGSLLVNMDSQAPNKVVGESLLNGTIKLTGLSKLVTVKAEKTYGDSRFDFYVVDEEGREGYVEVKGVTLESDGIASFPDAPTERGVKHLGELVKVKESGLYAGIVFVIQMEGMKVFTPNDTRHKAFGEALRNAKSKGVEVIAYGCRVTENTLTATHVVPVDLDHYNL